jgi:hypothetical protein
LSEDSKGWIGILFLAGIAAYIYWLGGIKTVWYSATYQVSTDKVHIDAEPTDCDFWHAPLGKKDCHYESEVTAVNAAGEVVGGDHAPKYRHDSQTGKPIVSYDYGKTWGWYPAADIPDPRATSVIVTWSKVKD